MAIRRTHDILQETSYDLPVPRLRDLSGTPLAASALGTLTVTLYDEASGDILNSRDHQDVRPLIIPPEQSCEVDSEADWREAVRRWKERHEGKALTDR